MLFEKGAPADEPEYEEGLWQRLQSLSDKDQWLGQRADPRVAHDPDDPHFAMSFGGEAFFVVGLHPGSSRPARRFCVPAMVFNLRVDFYEVGGQPLFGEFCLFPGSGLDPFDPVSIDERLGALWAAQHPRQALAPVDSHVAPANSILGLPQ